LQFHCAAVSARPGRDGAVLAISPPGEECAHATEHLDADMNPATFERFSRVMAEQNAAEIARRTEYHRSLVEESTRGPNREAGGRRGVAGRWLLDQLERRILHTERPQGEPESLDVFLSRYASLATWGEPVPDQVIAAMQPTTPFPADLVTFYRTQGWLKMGANLCNLSVHSLIALQAALTSERSYERFHSMGLADSINRVWGNGRPELDPSGENACYTREQIAALNHEYQVVAMWNDVESNDEAHFYIYYDRSHRFGIVHLHQDDWERWPTIGSRPHPPAVRNVSSDGHPAPHSFSTRLDALLEASGANRSWDQVLIDALDWVEERGDRP
jgi:hypothetical protein